MLQSCERALAARDEISHIFTAGSWRRREPLTQADHRTLHRLITATINKKAQFAGKICRLPREISRRGQEKTAPIGKGCTTADLSSASTKALENSRPTLQGAALCRLR